MINRNPIFLSDSLYKIVSPKWISSFTNIFTEHGIKHQFLLDTNDIWCRDYMPIQLGNNQFVQFKLTNDYYYKKTVINALTLPPSAKLLELTQSYPTYEGKPIYLDGGNVILNPSRTMAIITEKVFADNEIPCDILAGILQEVIQGGTDNIYTRRNW